MTIISRPPNNIGLSSEARVSLYRIRRLQNRERARESSISYKRMHDLIRLFASQLNLGSNVCETAFNLFKRLRQQHANVRPFDIWAVTFLYVAARLLRLPRHIYEFACIFEGATSYYRTPAFRQAVRAIYVRVRRLVIVLGLRLPPPIVQSFIVRGATLCGLPPDILSRALALSETVTIESVRHHMGKSMTPRSLAAGLLYLVVRETPLEVTSIDIANALGLSHMTVRKNRRVLLRLLSQQPES